MTNDLDPVQTACELAMQAAAQRPDAIGDPLVVKIRSESDLGRSWLTIDVEYDGHHRALYAWRPGMDGVDLWQD